MSVKLIANQVKRKASDFLFGKKMIKRVELPKYSELVNSYSQFGEDLVIDAILSGTEKGFYVDVGANDPCKMNNTYRFYKKGWRGINIEPQPFLFKKFTEDRGADINLNVGVYSKNQELTFYQMESHTLSTFNFETAKKNGEKYHSKIVQTLTIEVKTLAQILTDYLPPGVDISFLSIDTEGLDLEVLKGNDWSRFRPKVLLIELGSKITEINDFLNQHGYQLVYRSGPNAIYVLV